MTADEPYTPSTERIRSDYGENAEGTSDKRLAAFDRWLESVRAEARAEGEAEWKRAAELGAVAASDDGYKLGRREAEARG